MKKYSTLLSLYLAQSIPMSFFSTIVPVIMRQEHYSLTMIGLLQLVKLPWIFKFLWAPVVDKYGNSVDNFKRWIFSSELVYAIIILGIGFLNLKFDFTLIIFLMVLAFTASATQDIATDAFAIMVLKKEERSMGNSMQSAGTFLGTMAGSGVLLMMYYYFGWQGLMVCLAGFVILALIPLYFYKHKHSPSVEAQIELLSASDQTQDAKTSESGDALIRKCPNRRTKFRDSSYERASFKDIGLFFKQKGIVRRIILLFFFYSGIIGILSMVKPFLVDEGFTLKQIGIISGICGTASGTISALIAGVIIRRIGRTKSLYLIASIGVFTTLFFVWVVSGHATKMYLYTAVVMLWVTYGMASVAIYTISMDIVRNGREGTDFTIQIVVTHLSGIIMAIASGKLADALSYKGLFMLESLLAACVLISIPFLYKEKINNDDNSTTTS